MSTKNWKTPIIEGYGKIVHYPDAAMQPDTAKEYKVLFHITADKEIEGVNISLWKIARLINLLGGSGVPQQNIQIVAVVSGAATPLVLTHEAHQKRENKTNSNTDLLEKLTDFGVRIEVCGQAVAAREYTSAELNEYVQITPSALLSIPTYQMEGYVLLV